MNKVKNPHIWAVAAFLFGISAFCVYKSLVLLRQNSELAQSLYELKDKLSSTETSLRETTAYLKESSETNVRLEDELNLLNSKLVQKEKEAQQYAQNMSLISDKLNEALKANSDLASQVGELTAKPLRLELENSEMKRKLSSIQELKEAIRDLKIKLKEQKRVKKPSLPVESNKVSNIPEPKTPPEKNLPGNKGFIVKDGKTTFEGIVNIEVVPAEPGAL